MVSALIRIEDTDEPPYFENLKYTFSITESAAQDTYVGTVVARDADLDFDRYELINVQPPGTFTVEPKNGIISVGTNVFANKWQFDFEARALDNKGLYSSVPVHVNIIDENTHKPEFNECAELDGISVFENKTEGLEVVMVTAIDKDHGINGEVTYQLLNDLDTFAIETRTGHGYITTTRMLDRDAEDREFFLTVIAKDGAPLDEALQEACTFKIIVDDINDNPPNFDKPLYEQNIATDHNQETAVLRVTATDIDTLQNADILYSLDDISDDSSYFSVDNHTGIINLVKELDESMASVKTFQLLARATDKGRVPLTNTVRVKVMVVSSGSLPPSIIHTEAPKSIPENAPLQTNVATICAQSNVPNEPDVFFILVTGNTGDTNADGTFAIKKLGNNDPVCPSGSRGVVVYLAVRNLDYETITQYRLILQVVNTQNARVDKEVLVKIQDVNDIPPLLQPFDGAITENSPPILITTIKAIDKDASPQFRNLVYSFDGPDVTDEVRNKFDLSRDGQLRTLMRLDREEKNKYMIPVHVTDGDHNRTSMYWITVKDINDVKPRFDKTLGVYEVQVPEDKGVGKNTGIVLKVIDPDVVNHNDFQIVKGNEQRKFSIDSTTGEVTVATKLDYDDPMRDRNFTMLVRLSDGANEMAETYITIAVINVNDLQPVFDQSSYTFRVTENLDCSIPFGQVSAMDPDLPPDVDQNIEYYLHANERVNFTIHATSGQLSIVGCLDREAATRGSMTIYPLAKDDAGDGYDAEPSAVTIEINDQNDNHPFIQSPENSYTKFMENTDPRTVTPVIIQLADWDTEEHGCPCTLALDDSTSADIVHKFGVTKVEAAPSRFSIVPLVTLDREAQKVYKLPFRTTDRDGVNGIRILTVEVGDKNDSPMSDGQSTIQVYNYLGQFPKMVIGTVHVTDLDDYDVGDKVFEIDPSTNHEVDTNFDVDYNSGEITMLKGAPDGTYLLRVKVEDQFRNEVAFGEVTIRVMDLTEEAIMQSGSFRVKGYSSLQLFQQQETAVTGTSLYERLKNAIANIHEIPAENVDIFCVRDVGSDVDVRYNCHGSPYFTASRLNGLMLTYLSKLNSDLKVKISQVNLDRCLYENDPARPCGTSIGGSTSCQQTLKANMTSPLVVAGDTVTMVGVDITDEYDCSCGTLEPLPSVCYEGYCFNGGVCKPENNTLVCECPSNKDYGPRCELLSARFEKGYAWYEPPKVCENSTIFMSFQTYEKTGILLYSGPTVTRPWHDYPKDFVYVVLNNWVLETYIDLGTGTVSISIALEKNTIRTFDYSITWNHLGITFEVMNCSGSSNPGANGNCKKSVPLIGGSGASHLLNLAAPLQLGGVAAMVSFQQLANSYDWSITPPSVDPFHGCVNEFRHKDFLYDLNSTDYDKETYKPCNAPTQAKVIMGNQSIVIIVVSLLCLIMLVLLILCLARRKKKTVSCPELDGIVKETIGSTDIEGFGEKDMTQYDLKLLRVGPDGYLLNDVHGEKLSYTNPLMHERLQGDADHSTLSTERRRLPDVADDTLQKCKAPIALMPEGLSIGEFIDDNIKKVDKDPSDFDDVRHYCYEGDAMSIASLSSIGSGRSTDSDDTFDYKNDWGPRFKKLNEIYKRGSDEDDDSDFEFNVPKQRKRASLPPAVTETPPESPTDKPVTTSRPSEEPTVTYGGTGGGGGERPPPRATAEPFSPASPYGQIEGAESWC
ncbi:DE-cadherin [Chionoecetes opilio]|uniref:DE-cadherin n=1 Tax=Chionoecetes opilio TaxID=41210 RepID=A0A8J4YIE9_CHIOP|nr:DE-cadherin [Chionoecetes opilio]